jgi:hypothetical protein
VDHGLVSAFDGDLANTVFEEDIIGVYQVSGSEVSTAMLPRFTEP